MSNAAEKKEVFRQAAELISARDYTKAGEVLERAVELCEHEDAQMLVTIDNFYRQTDDYKMRLKIVDKLLLFGVDPRDVLPFKMFHLSALQRYKEALAIGELFVSNFGTDNKVTEGIARIYQDIGRAADSVPYIEKLLDQADGMPFNEGMSYYSSLMNTQAYTRVYGNAKYKKFLARIYKNTKAYARELPPSGGGYFKKLKAAYLSPDFRGHPIGYFIYPVIMNMEKREHETFCFSLYHVNKDDSTTNMYGIDFAADFKSKSKYQVIEHMKDDRKEKAVMREKPDIAFDLSSHTMANKLFLFARRIAPVQITFIGWPSSTGVAAMDYAIVDAITDPPGSGSEEFYTEKLIRMSKTSLCHILIPKEPVADAPPVKKNGYITFGCFCNIQKMTPETIKLLIRTVKAVKGSRLLIKGSYPDEVKEDMMQRFVDAGMPKKSITVEQQARGAEYPKSYHRVDIILDTVPFNGATTTCDALNMGVPVITVSGDNQSSRRGLSILRNVGLDELIASSEGEYVKLAATLANDIPRLEFYRANLRRIKSESNLADAEAFVDEFTFHVRKAWVDCCREFNIPETDYSRKTDAELSDEKLNAEKYMERDKSEDVLKEYDRLNAEYEVRKHG